MKIFAGIIFQYLIGVTRIPKLDLFNLTLIESKLSVMKEESCRTHMETVLTLQSNCSIARNIYSRDQTIVTS